MNNYDFLIANRTLAEELIRRGLLSFTIIRDLDIYEAFKRMEGFTNVGRYAILSHDFQLSEKRIQQIVSNLNK